MELFQTIALLYYAHSTYSRIWMDTFSSDIFLNFLLQRLEVFITCLLRITPKYFILFVDIVKGVVLLPSLSILYGKVTDYFLVNLITSRFI